MQLKRNPWIYVPALYFLQGIPVVIVQQISVVAYKKLGISNAQIALWTSLVTWPWILKMFWSPVIERYGTKRIWILSTQFSVSLLLLLLALSFGTTYFFSASLLTLLSIAFFSATHDIAADGFYLLALSERERALFVGIRSTAFRLATIFGSGVLVVIAGSLELRGYPIATTWRVAILAGCLVYALGFLVNMAQLPKPARDFAQAKEAHYFFKVTTSYFRHAKLIPVLSFILLYRFGESMLVKMTAPFLLDSAQSGGLAVTTQDVGIIMGYLGVSALTLGGIFGGYLISTRTLARAIWPMAILMHLPNALYLWAAYAHPSRLEIYLLVGTEQFAYGFGFSAYLVYLMLLSQDSPYPASHYAISSGLMALGAMIAGIASGLLQSRFGYSGLFWAACLVSLVSVSTLWFLPLRDEEIRNNYAAKL